MWRKICCLTERVTTLEEGGGGGASTFLGLSDTPVDYTGDANKLVTVNPATNSLEFTDILSSNTKAEIATLISTNGLIPGKNYKITGVDIPLYGGTDIILTAVTNNQLSLQGAGIFYDPIYNPAIVNQGVFTNSGSFVASGIVGTFNTREAITANTGGTGLLLTTIGGNRFTITAGT